MRQRRGTVEVRLAIENQDRALVEDDDEEEEDMEFMQEMMEFERDFGHTKEQVK